MMSMNKSEEQNIQALKNIAWIENKKGRNHPLPEFRKWMKENRVDLCTESWNPKRVHIAGTNGKGSVCEWMSEMAISKGLNTGVFTSPHLVSHTERIRINQNPISLSGWNEIYETWKDFFEEHQMTMFEIDLWMSMVEFQKRNPDLILMETGLGGRRDATTAPDYDLCIITNIGFDHMAYLGNTIEEIADAKAGILIENIPACLGIMDPEAGKVIEKEAKQKHSPLNRLTQQDRDDFFQNHPRLNAAFKKSLLPDYQKENFLLALNGMKELGFSFSEDELEKLIRSFSWKGRFTILSEQPLIVADGAHNLHGIKALCDSITKGEFDQAYFSVLADKQGEEMIRMLEQKIKTVTLVDFDTPRLADLHELAKKLNLKVCSCSEMLERLKKTAQNTLICGSLYFVGDLLRDFQEESAEPAEQ